MTPNGFVNITLLRIRTKTSQIFVNPSSINKKRWKVKKSNCPQNVGRERAKVEKSVEKLAQNTSFSNFPLKFL